MLGKKNSRTQHWLLKSILLPFALTRGLIVLTGYLAPTFLSLNYSQDPEVMARGWWFSSNRLLEMWFRWDAGWYFTIVKEGYRMVENVHTMSNLAFFPMFPLLIRLFLLPFPQSMVTDELILGMGLIVNNLLLIGSLVLIYKLCRMLFEKKAAANLAVWLLLVFPASFFLSSFYSEASFLFFSLLTVYLAKKKKWAWASLAAAVTGVTRVVGLIAALPLIWEYLDAKDWKLKNLDFSVLWFGIVPLGVLVFFSYLYYLTGDFLAAVKVQSAWGRRTSNPLLSFISPTGYWPLVTQIDRMTILAVLGSGLGMMFKKLKALLPLGLYSILLILPPLLTGTLDSTTRYAVVAFPMFMYGGYLLEKLNKGKRWLKWVLMIGLMMLQLILFARYSQFYWGG